jgi:hydroxysqualene dehydroxylase
VDRDAHELARPLVPRPLRLAVIGGGWAGLAAAVEATQRGHAVTLFEMAPRLGGRARAVVADGVTLDNGQHILIGAYTETLRLMRVVGVDVARAFVRTPLRISDAAGVGLRLRPGAPLPAFAMAVLRHHGWRWRDKLALLRIAASWSMRGFDCAASTTVAELTATLPEVVRGGLIEPLCVAALNTPAAQASARVFLRVLKDALFSGAGSADLLLPCVNLSDAFATPAMRWLEQAGAALRLSQRVEQVRRDASHWLVDGTAFDRVVLATSALEAARLTRTLAPDWSACAAALRYEPIVTVYLRCADTRLAEPMLALRADALSPAQFVFDRGQLGGPPGLLAFVVSGAQAWVDRGADAIVQATLRQARVALGASLRGTPLLVKTITEKRATFRCAPDLRRPTMHIAPGLLAAADHVDGPYPATLEGAVRSAVAAVHALA